MDKGCERQLISPKLWSSGQFPQATNHERAGFLLHLSNGGPFQPLGSGFASGIK